MSNISTALMRLSAGAGLALTAAVALCACGSSSSQVGPSGPVQAARGVRPLHPTASAGRGSEQSVSVGRRSRRGGAGGSGAITRSGPVRARAQQGLINDEVASTAAKPLNPCALVTRAEAQRIMEGPVLRPLRAPQGPTCVYRSSDAARLVTLRVQSRISGQDPQDRLQDRMRVKISGRSAYCGVAGSPVLILPLPRDRFMAVSAPCPIAAAFATKALARMRAHS